MHFDRDEIFRDTSDNSCFSSRSPGLMLTVDAHSLSTFKECPRKFFYSVVQGWQERDTGPHLMFGLALHLGLEVYEKAKHAGHSHDAALGVALLAAMKFTWNKALGRPWISTVPEKNRVSLARTLVWYLDAFGTHDTMKTLVVAGAPAVELRFCFQLGMASGEGEAFALCGRMDRLVEFAGSNYVVDHKTTKSQLGSHYFASYSPDCQVSLYTVAGTVAFKVPLAGMVIDGIQVGATFARFQRQPISRHPTSSSEWLAETGWWLRQMEACSDTLMWPQNDKSCHKMLGCQFREVCSRPPGARAQWLKLNFTRRMWDPMKGPQDAAGLAATEAGAGAAAGTGAVPQA
jgi:hypothetical protein